MWSKPVSDPALLPSNDADVTDAIWRPGPRELERSNISAALRDRGFESYNGLYRWSIDDPEGFWGYVVNTLGIRFAERPHRILDDSGGPANAVWLPGGRMNIAESCFQADALALALVWAGSDGELHRVSYGELRRLANRVAHGLQRLGLQPGDGVAVFMPMTARSVAIYLGIVLAGCVVVSIADSFSAEQIQTRLRIGRSAAVFTVSSILRASKRLAIYERLVAADGPRTILADDSDITLRNGDLYWSGFLSDDDAGTVTHASPDAPINVLFSSGTTGDPKAIPWDHTTPIKVACDGLFHHDIHPGDVVAWPTSLGWMMGPWLVFAALINRGSIALYDGSPLEPGFGRFIQDARVTMLGVVPSLVRQWRKDGCIDGLNWSAIRAFSSTGECSNRDDMRFLSGLAGGKPIIEYCGGTEIGGGYITSTVVQPNVAGAFSTPALGSTWVILDNDGRPASEGELYLLPPAMGLSRRLLNGDHHEVYFADTPVGPGGRTLRRHGDVMLRMLNGYYRALGRADDTMNIGGIKVSAVEIEQALTGVGEVREVAAVAVLPPQGGPSRLVICAAVAEPGHVDAQRLKNDMQQAIKSRLNPLFRIDDLYLLEDLPRTASNKILRRVLRKDYEARDRGACDA